MRYYISKYSLCLLLVGIVYLLQYFLLIILLKMPKIMCGSIFYLHEILFLITSLILVKKSFKIDRLA